MSSIALNHKFQTTVTDVLRQFNDIQLLAKSTKGTAAGRIGMIGDHVVKFNTHWQERAFTRTTDDMLTACANLRERICALLDTLVQGDVLTAEQAVELKAQIGSSESRSLLDRSVVAAVIRDAKEAMKERLAPEQFVELEDREELASRSSDKRKTTFRRVQTEVELQRLSTSLCTEWRLDELGAKAEGRFLTSADKGDRFNVKELEVCVRKHFGGAGLRKAFTYAFNLFSENSPVLRNANEAVKEHYLEFLANLDRMLGDDRVEERELAQKVMAALNLAVFELKGEVALELRSVVNTVSRCYEGGVSSPPSADDRNAAELKRLKAEFEAVTTRQSVEIDRIIKATYTPETLGELVDAIEKEYNQHQARRTHEQDQRERSWTLAARRVEVTKDEKGNLKHEWAYAGRAMKPVKDKNGNLTYEWADPEVADRSNQAGKLDPNSPEGRIHTLRTLIENKFKPDDEKVGKTIRDALSSLSPFIPTGNVKAVAPNYLAGLKQRIAVLEGMVPPKKQ